MLSILLIYRQTPVISIACALCIRLKHHSNAYTETPPSQRLIPYLIVPKSQPNPPFPPLIYSLYRPPHRL